MAYQILPEFRHSIECLAEWYKRTGNIKKYNQTVMRFNLGLPLEGYGDNA